MRVSVVAAGLRDSTKRLQPWRYLTEAAIGLAAMGHEVEIATDEAIADLPGVSIWSPAPGGRRGAAESLCDHLRSRRPAVVLWNIGTTSALHFRPPILSGTRHIAVFTSPLYRPSEVFRVGADLARHPVTYGALGLGSLLPRRGIARYLAAEFAHVIAPGSTTARRLVAGGLEPDRITALPPGREVDIGAGPVSPRVQTDITTFVYAGSPLPIRGPDLLIRAFAQAHPTIGSARLLILSRHERAELAQQTERLVALAAHLRVERWVEVVSGTLPRVEFLKQVARADAFVLPFRLVPSEAPLAVLEAAGAGRPLIASALPAVTDLAAPGSLLTRPGRVDELSRALVSLTTDPAQAHQLGSDARRWYAGWPTWPEVVERLASVLASLTGTAAAGVDSPRSRAVGEQPTRVP